MSETKLDPFEFTRVVKGVFKIKALFQKQLAIKKVRNLAEQKVHKAQAILQSDDKEGQALFEFVSQLKAKRISPEGFFRMCDISYAKSVPVDIFKENLLAFGIKLTPTQQKRLVLILDECFTGSISLEEYQDALEAYELSGERHFLGNQGTKRFHPIQSKVLEAFIDLMSEQDITPDELFSIIDEDDSGFIDINELRSYLMKIMPTLMLKDLKGIQTYFKQFDVNGDGQVTRDDFNLLFPRIKRIVEKKKEIDFAAENDEFADNIDAGDQTLNPSTMNKSTTPAKDNVDPKMQNIVSTMEGKDGMGPKVFLSLCLDKQKNADTMPLPQFLVFFNNAYPKIPVESMNYVKEKIQAKDKSGVSLSLMEVQFNKYGKNKTVESPKLLSFLGNYMFSLVKKEVPSSVGAAIDMVLVKYMTQLGIKNDSLTMAQYVKLNEQLCSMRREYSELIFAQNFNLNNNQTVQITEVRRATEQAVTCLADIKAAPSQTAKDVDMKIPGFSKLSPRSQANSAVTQLIKEMKTVGIKPIQVFSASSDQAKDSALNLKLKETFKKFLTQVSPFMIDAACSSFGLDVASVSKATFLNTFDQAFDNATQDPKTQAKQGTRRPTTAPSVVPMKQAEADALIRKLDTAFLEQGISHLTAFKKADTDNSGEVSCFELKNSIQLFLQGSDMQPAEFKMLMQALDVNRNGRIEQQEFLDVFKQARERNSATPQPAKKPEAVPLDKLPQKLNDLGVKTQKKSEDEKALLLKVILKIECANPTNILGYWNTDQPLPDKKTYVTTVANVLTQPQAEALYDALRIDSRGLYQDALNVLFSALDQSPDSEYSATDFKLVLDSKISPQGTISTKEAASTFMKMHVLPNKDYILNAINGVERGIGIKQDDLMTRTTLNKALPVLIKSLFVNSSSVPDDESANSVNWLAFATGVFLGTTDEVFAPSFQDYWKKICQRYLQTIYAQLSDFGPDAQSIHIALRKNPRASQIFIIKKLSVVKWLNLLYNNTGAMDPSIKCLNKFGDSRIKLPEYMTTDDTMEKIIKKIELSLGGVISKPNDTIELPPLKAIENQLDDSISTALFPLIMQDIITADAFYREITTHLQQEATISQNTVKRLFVAAGSNGNTIKVAQLVRYVIVNETKAKFDYPTVLKTFADKIKSPIDKNLKHIVSELGGDNDEDITKEEFMKAFDQFVDGRVINKWSLVCLFCKLDELDEIDDRIKLATLVKAISEVSSQKLVTAEKQVSKKPTITDLKQTPKLADKVVAPKTVPAKAEGQNQVVDGMRKFFLREVFSENVTLAQVKADKDIDLTPNHCKLFPSNENVVEYCDAVRRLGLKLVSEGQFKIMMKKFNNFKRGTDGNDEEAVMNIILPDIQQLMEEHAQVEEINVLVARHAFSALQTNDGKPVFDEIDLLQISLLLLDREQINLLGANENEILEFITMPDPTDMAEDDEVPEFIEHGMEHLRISHKLCVKICEAAAQADKQGQNFDIAKKPQEGDWDAWAKIRFQNLADPIAAKFSSNPKALSDFIAKLRQRGDEITYFQLVKCVSEAIGQDKIQQLDIEPWEWEDFCYMFDDCNMAYVTFNDVNEWLQDCGLKTGIPLANTDAEDALRLKQNVSPDDYKLNPEQDYFRNCPTILNSEVAALKKVREIFDSLDDAQEWIDPDFGPKGDYPADEEAELDEEYKTTSAKSIYFDPENPPHGYPDPETIVWKTPKQYLQDGGETKEAGFIIHDASSNEVRQGALGDCWFVGALSVIATKDHLVKGGAPIGHFERDQRVDPFVAQQLSKGVYPPIFHIFRLKGIFVMRFFKDFGWRYVLIDSRIPVSRSNNEPVFARCELIEELWVPLIEKAYAKLFGCYQTLISGSIDDGVVDMTGLICEKRIISNQDGTMKEDVDKLWDYLLASKRDGSLMGCSTSGETERDTGTGIMSGHAYSINDVFELPRQPGTLGKRDSHRLLRVRNPWGRGEWQGKWSDQSDEQKKYEKEFQAYLNELEDDEKFQIGEDGADDGTFFINYQEWRTNYNKIFIAKDFEEEWNAVRFRSRWVEATAGGVPFKETPEMFEQFAKNPQFRITPTQDCELFVSLGQNDGRVVKDGQYDVYPFKRTMTSCILFVFQLPKDKNGSLVQDRLTKYTKDPNLKLKQVNPTAPQEVSTRVPLKKGESYVVIPAIKQNQQTGQFDLKDAEFILSLLINIPLYQVDIVNVNDLNQRYEYIPEENEKSIKNVSKWKRDMCQNETLKYMIINEDIKTTYISAKKKKAQAPKAQQNSAVSRGNTLAQQKTATGKK